MKFTIIDSFTNKSRRIEVKKTNDSTLDILQSINNTDKPMARITAANGKVTFIAEEGVGWDTQDLLTDSDPEKEATEDELRNWTINKRVLKVTHPLTKEVVEMTLGNKSAPKCPEDIVPEILGQPEMVSAVAFSLAKNKHSMLVGPTGTGKTTIYRWFAQKLGWNYITCPIARGTEAAHLIGEYVPTGPATFEWLDGPVTEAVRLSQHHPTILVFDELNRIGNIAEFARIYSVLDDTKMLELKEKRHDDGTVERLDCGNLIIGATSNPSDDERADYIGVQDLDPALISRFPIQPTVDYPPIGIEVEALLIRVPELDRNKAIKMCRIARNVRESEEVRFPLSFRELQAWAEAEPYFGFEEAARVAVINKCPMVFRTSLEGLMQLS